MPGPLLHSLRLKLLVRDRAGSLRAAVSLHNAPKQLELASGSDCVLPTEYDAAVPSGCIVLDPVQAFNLRICNNEAYEFKPFEMPPEPAPFQLCDLEAEARILPLEAASLQGKGAEIVRVDIQSIVEALQEQACGTVVAVNQSFVLGVKAALDHPKQQQGASQASTTTLTNVQLALRVTCTDTLDEEQQAQVVAGYHCYRGVLTRSTRLYFHTATRPGLRGSAASHSQPQDRQESNGSSASGLQLVLERPRHKPPPKNRRDTIDVHTVDCEGGEVFTVKKELLRPCIALTSAIRDESAEAPPPVHVDVDTLTFDRVLLFLESRVLKQDPPMWSLHLIGDLARAADVLGLRPLVSYCQERLGNLSDNLKIWRFDEVKHANDQGKSLLILDGMVLDVTNWLSEHPGGPNIIPAQALNVDCGRFFEIYHASRESFLYLHDFYLGEIHPDDRPKVQQARGEHPSEDFLQQLAQYTPWRLAVSSGPSGDHLHLGRSAR